MTALFCSTIFQKSATSLICTYLIIVVMFLAPVAATFFAETFFHGTSRRGDGGQVGRAEPVLGDVRLPLEYRATTTSNAARRRPTTCACSSATSAGRFCTTRRCCWR